MVSPSIIADGQGGVVWYDSTIAINEMGNVVVYQWLREDGSPYYVGIGKPRRPYTGKRRCGRPPSKERIVILHENLEWEEACQIEKELIAFYGRKDLGTGILRNLTDGGEGVIGLSEESKIKMSEAKRGKKLSESAKKKLSKANKGKKLSERTKRKISESKKGENNPFHGKKHSKETKKKLSEERKGEKNQFYGKKHSEETRRKMSEARKSIPRDWYHPIYGEVLQKSVPGLIRMFPKQKLTKSALSRVALGKASHHKGWKILEVN